MAMPLSLSHEFVPENLKTMKLCLAAVQENSLAIEFVPENLKATVLAALEEVPQANGDV